MPSSEWMMITIGAVLVNNVVLTHLLGICPFLGASKSLKTALKMSAAVIFVMTFSSFFAALLDRYVLSLQLTVAGRTFDLHFLHILLFMITIALIVQVSDSLLKRFASRFYRDFGIYLPLIATNCAILGVAELNTSLGRGVLGSTVFGFCSGIGFGLALMLFASLRERLDLSDVPKPMRGTPIA